MFKFLRFVIVNQDVDEVIDVDIDSFGEIKFQFVKEGRHNICFAVNKLVYTQIIENF